MDQQSMNHQEQIFPRGFKAYGKNIGLKESLPDFGVVHCETPCTAAAMFTRNNFPSHPVVVGKEHVRGGILQTVIVNSANANVATGPAGLTLVREYCAIAAENLGISPERILPSSTGVIGRPLPGDAMKHACAEIASCLRGPDFEGFSRAIMTTDSYPKLKSRSLSDGIRILAVAKGAGMIQPDMATMLAYIFTDAKIEQADLHRLLRSIVNRSFNRISVDGDTSTSDTVACLAGGQSGIPIRFPTAAADFMDACDDPFADGVLDDCAGLGDADREFATAMGLLCRDLARMIVRDGEGATRLVELIVGEARDREQALKIGRSLINSPLLKTAIHGADPNWGRIIMAIGKVFDEPVPLEGIRIFINDLPLPVRDGVDRRQLEELSRALKNEQVYLKILLGTGEAVETLWGCDLTAEYVRINSAYTT